MGVIKKIRDSMNGVVNDLLNSTEAMKKEDYISGFFENILNIINKSLKLEGVQDWIKNNPTQIGAVELAITGFLQLIFKGTYVTKLMTWFADLTTDTDDDTPARLLADNSDSNKLITND